MFCCCKVRGCFWGKSIGCVSRIFLNENIYTIKSHEFYTGAIVEVLAKQIGCYCITKQYLVENTTNDDPNTDNAYCSYKTAINQFMQKNDIKLFVDIHGLSGKRESVVDICVDGGKNVNNMEIVYGLKNKIETKFGVNTCSIDKYFQASSENIMSKWFYSTFGISAIQLEINGAYRWFEADNEKQSLDLFLVIKNWLEDIM